MGAGLKPSARAGLLPASPIRKLKPYADAAEKRGIRIHNMNIGQPDVATAPWMLEALRTYNEKVVAYCPSQGLDNYRARLSRYYAGVGLDVTPDQLIVTTGGSEALSIAFTLVGDPGDEILIPEPFYTNYNSFAVIAGLTIKTVPTTCEEGFHLPPRAVIEAAIGPRTKALLICSPNNPTGTVFTHDEMKMLVDIAKQHQLFIVSDEVYREFVFDDARWVSPLHFPEVREQTLLVDSLSKRYSACGVRLGSLAIFDPELYGAGLRYAMSRLSPPTISQVMGLPEPAEEAAYIAKTRDTYKERRDAAYAVLSATPGVVTRLPEGAFYITAKLPIEDADDFCIWMLENFAVDGETTMVAPAAGFYATPGAGKNEVRAAFVLDTDRTRRAMNILMAGLDAYRTAKKR